MTTFSLEQVVADWDLTDEMSDPVGWLARQIRSGRVTARKMGRSWRMTQADIDAAMDVFASQPRKSKPVEKEQPRGGLSAASMRRRRVA
ncbi:hypothetical protein [Mycobacteroides abscessus]|uniref:hypothetical protein n=1 Tax=Mycobacteroides abscessus TaxID=36809 RepID=UPI0018966A75